MLPTSTLLPGIVNSSLPSSPDTRHMFQTLKAMGQTFSPEDWQDEIPFEPVGQA